MALPQKPLHLQKAVPHLFSSSRRHRPSPLNDRAKQANEASQIELRKEIEAHKETKCELEETKKELEAVRLELDAVRAVRDGFRDLRENAAIALKQTLAEREEACVRRDTTEQEQVVAQQELTRLRQLALDFVP